MCGMYVMLMGLGQVVYWWKIAANEDGSHEIGVNTRNVDPEEMKYVERRIQFDAVDMALKDKTTRHPEDKAEYA